MLPFVSAFPVGLPAGVFSCCTYNVLQNIKYISMDSTAVGSWG